MYPPTYYGYYGQRQYGCGYWMPYGTYPWPNCLETSPSRHPIVITVPLPQPFGSASPWYYHPGCPAPRTEVAPTATVTKAPCPPPSHDPCSRRAPEGVPHRHPCLGTNQAVPTQSPLTVDPILALPNPPCGRSGLHWDLADNPIRVVFDHPENCWIRRSGLTRAAVRDGTRTLEKFFLIFRPALCMPPREREAQIEVTHTHPTPRLGADEDVSWVTVYDVLMAIFLWLQSPISGADETGRLECGQGSSAVQMAEARRRRRAGCSCTVGCGPYLKIDYLGERRRFKGIRPAVAGEVPAGRTLREVFVIELGTSV